MKAELARYAPGETIFLAELRKVWVADETISTELAYRFCNQPFDENCIEEDATPFVVMSIEDEATGSLIAAE